MKRRQKELNFRHTKVDFSTHKSRISGHESLFSGHESLFFGHESLFFGHESLFSGHESLFSGHESPISGHKSVGKNETKGVFYPFFKELLFFSMTDFLILYQCVKPTMFIERIARVSCKIETQA